MPIRDRYVDASAEWSSQSGTVLRGEAGTRVGEHVAAFIFGEWRPKVETRVGVGVRATW